VSGCPSGYASTETVGRGRLEESGDRKEWWRWVALGVESTVRCSSTDDPDEVRDGESTGAG
jgi:hypothetical protein